MVKSGSGKACRLQAWKRTDCCPHSCTVIFCAVFRYAQCRLACMGHCGLIRSGGTNGWLHSAGWASVYVWLMIWGLGRPFRSLPACWTGP
ncbi:hypothetical protein D3C75_687990 [compost metagenome]